MVWIDQETDKLSTLFLSFKPNLFTPLPHMMTTKEEPLAQILAALADLQQQNVAINQKVYYPYP